MLLDLIVAELENLQLVRERSLGRLRLSEVVNYFAIGECLLDVLVVEVDDGVAIWERLSFDSIIEDDLLLSVLVDPLDLSIMPHVLLDYFLVLQGLAVILFGEFETEVLLFVRVATLVGTFAPVLDLKIYLLLHFVIVLLIEVSVPSSASVHSTDRPTCEVIENLVSFFSLQLLFICVTVVCVAPSLLIPILHLIVIRTKVVMGSTSILVHLIDFLIDIIFVLEEHLVSHLLVLLLILLVSLDA